MRGVLYEYLSNDHDRLNALLLRAVETPGIIDMKYYSEFRKGILRHISMEEKIVIPAITRYQGGSKVAIAARLRLDHGAIVSLLVPPPTQSIIFTIRSIFEVHNPLEERKDGLYDLLESLAGSEADKILRELKVAPAVAVLPHNEKPEALETTRIALARAGYRLEVEGTDSW
jgi:hypothetical protein